MYNQQVKLLNHKTNGLINTDHQSDNDIQQQNNEVTSISASYFNMLRLIGEDPTREGLLKTPERAAKAMLHFTKGYHQNLNSIFN